MPIGDHDHDASLNGPTQYYFPLSVKRHAALSHCTNRTNGPTTCGKCLQFRRYFRPSFFAAEEGSIYNFCLPARTRPTANAHQRPWLPGAGPSTRCRSNVTGNPQKPPRTMPCAGPGKGCRYFAASTPAPATRCCPRWSWRRNHGTSL
jgi:hypothetical protein